MAKKKKRAGKPLAKQLRALEAAVRRMHAAAELGAVAKRNARSEFLAASRNLRAAVDREYVVPRRKTARRRRRRTPGQRASALVAAGFERITSPVILARLTKAGIKITAVAGKDPVIGNVEGLFAPGWAALIAKKRPEQLAAAKRSPSDRKAIVAEIELKQRDW